MNAKLIPQVGDEYRIPYPFVYDTSGREWGGGWKPGIQNIWTAPDDTEPVAEAMGVQILSVVGVYRPGKFPVRVFYTQNWVPPIGPSFGKTSCRIATLGKFRRRVNGYAFPFRLVTRAEIEQGIAA